MRIPAHLRALRALVRARVDFVLVGAFAVGHYAEEPGAVYATQDCDVLLRPEPSNLRRALRALRLTGYSLSAGGEPLPIPDALTATRIVERRAVVRGDHPLGLAVELLLQTSGFSYAQWRRRRRFFRVAGARLPVGNLRQLLRSKELAGREKDRAFLKLYAARLLGEKHG